MTYKSVDKEKIKIIMICAHTDVNKKSNIIFLFVQQKSQNIARTIEIRVLSLIQDN